MTTDNETSVINVTQADRDLAYDILSPLAENGVHLFELRGLKEGSADDADAVQLVARHRTTSLAAQDGLVEALKEARRSLKMQEGAEIWNSNCVECDGEGEWTECPICSDAFGKAIDARNATFPLIDAALSAIKGDKS